MHFCDVCKRCVPPEMDGNCGSTDCVDAVMAQEAEERHDAECDPYDTGGESG